MHYTRIPLCLLYISFRVLVISIPHSSLREVLPSSVLRASVLSIQVLHDTHFSDQLSAFSPVYIWLMGLLFSASRSLMLYSCFISRLATFTITYIYDYDKRALIQSSTFSATLLVLPTYMSHPVIYSDMDEPTPKRAIYFYTRPPLNTRPIHKPSKSTFPPIEKAALSKTHPTLLQTAFLHHASPTPARSGCSAAAVRL